MKILELKLNGSFEVLTKEASMCIVGGRKIIKKKRKDDGGTTPPPIAYAEAYVIAP